MSRVLFLTYHFPPTGGAGVQRSAKFARYLREFGYEPVVVTAPRLEQSRWAPADDSLLSDLPADLEVCRVGGIEPIPSRRRARLERLLRLRSPFADWWTSESVQAARAAQPFDLVLATMSPFESAEAAETIARDAGVPWIADLRDPWALDEMQVYPSALHRRLETKRMRRLLRPAAAVVMNTPEAAQRVIAAFPEIGASRVTAIPNGFDPADFDTSLPPRADPGFRIVHAGYLHTDLAGEEGLARRMLGGSTTGVHRPARSLLYLCEAIRQLEDGAPELAGRVELHVAGVLTPADRATFGSVTVREHGYLPHQRAVELMRSADLLFLPMHDLPAGRRATIVPGKLYEYLAAGRPILAAVPDGDARDLLGAVPQAILCRPTATSEMTRAIAELLRDPRPSEAAPTEVLARFERRNLTGDLASLFDAVLGESTSPRGHR